MPKVVDDKTGELVLEPNNAREVDSDDDDDDDDDGYIILARCCDECKIFVSSRCRSVNIESPSLLLLLAPVMTFFFCKENKGIS